jgi:hypothetical protein
MEKGRRIKMHQLQIIDETKEKQTTATKKTSASSKKKPAASTAKASSSQLKLTAAEKKLVQNYRKGNKLEKELIAMLVEKASEDLLSDKNNTINQFISSLLK